MISRILRHPATLGSVSVIGLALLVYKPQATNLIRAAEAMCALFIVTSILVAVWPRRTLRYGVMACLGVFVLVFLCPFGGKATPEEERLAVVNAARAYESTGYVWGGESPRGIDCSGLVRRAYMDAARSTAWEKLSPHHLRRAARLWWRDQSASNFENHAPISGKRIAELPTLRGETPASVLPGDVAIVADGVHVLLYLGEHRWIQADPSNHHVHEDDSRTSKNLWLNGRAVILRPGFLAE